MNIKLCYEKIAGDYDGTLSRLCGSELLMGKLLGKYLDDSAMSDLAAAIEAKNCEAAFKAVHTMKGTALNLGFTKLAKSASELTEALRGGSFPDNLDIYEVVKQDYNEVVNAIKEMM